MDIVSYSVAIQLFLTGGLSMEKKKHQHGEMDISTQKEAFSRFISFGLYLSYAVIGALVFLALFNS